MKTTIEIADSLLAEARRVAAREDTTVRALVEQGLRHVLAERKRSGAFHLRKASFKGDGLQPGVATASWERIREMAYEERGG
jgi:Arc/MetJ family transcription regulator